MRKLIGRKLPLLRYANKEFFNNKFITFFYLTDKVTLIDFASHPATVKTL